MTEPQETERAVVCPYCGGTEFVDGMVPVVGPMMFHKTFANGRRPAGKPVVARLCEGCGNVQLVVKGKA